MDLSPYLSPPEEFMSYTEGPSSDTINPQILSAAVSGLNDSSESNHFPDASATSPSVHAEHDEDYGFSKFAAERDAIRDQSELDEDTKLLMSEEGKKLTSKERRQLRNKVSARNFRERRKEYITHLESLVSKHQLEATQYKAQVDVLTTEKDELSSELSRLKISISAAFESNKLAQQQSTQYSTAASSNALPSTLTRTLSRSSTPTKEMNLIPHLTKDVNPYSAGASFTGDWPLSSLGSPSSGSFEFNLHNYTSVFSARPDMPNPHFSEKELLGKNAIPETDPASDPTNCLIAFDQVLTSILGHNWASLITPAPIEESSVTA